MKTSSKMGLAAALALLLIGAVLWVAGQQDTRTPEQQITASLKDAEDAARRGSVSGVMDVVSNNFQAGNWNKPRLRLILSRTLQAGRGVDYDVHVNHPIISLTANKAPDQRLVQTRFAAFYRGTGENISDTASNQPVLLVMRRETRRHWLVFSEPYWRITGVVGAIPLPGGEESGGLL